MSCYSIFVKISFAHILRDDAFHYYRYPFHSFPELFIRYLFFIFIYLPKAHITVVMDYFSNFYTAASFLRRNVTKDRKNML